MRHLLHSFAFAVFMIILASCQGNRSNSTKESDSYGKFRIKKGTNVGHWLSQSEHRGKEREDFFTEKDVKFIDSVGFDHIRIPIDEVQMWDESGKRHDDAFALLNNSLEWCKKTGLRAIVDLHILRSHHFNEGEKLLWTVPAEQDKFIRLWKDLSGFLNKWPNGMVAYEPMNEPVAKDPEQWNSLINRMVDSIRSWEPARVIVIGSNMWQYASTFDQLRVPANDTNLLLSFHFYEPMYLTHYQAGWTEFRNFKGEVNYPGQIVLNGKNPAEMKVYNRDTLLYMMRKPIHVADSLRLPLYCGEFGVYRNFFPQAKINWYKDMVSIFTEYGVAYANWNYKSDAFGLVDEQMKPDTAILHIMTHPGE